MSEQVKGSPSEDLTTKKGTVLRMDGDTCFVNWGDRGYGCLHTNYTTQNTRAIKHGDSIEARADAHDRALLLRLITHS